LNEVKTPARVYHIPLELTQQLKEDKRLNVRHSKHRKPEMEAVK
jgi:hypothetical protein